MKEVGCLEELKLQGIRESAWTAFAVDLCSVCSLLLSLLLVLLFVLIVALDYDQVVVFVRRYHHVVYFASHAQESEIVLGVEIADQTASGYRQLRQAHCVGGRLGRFAHGGAHNLGLVALLHLGLLDDDQALHALVLLDTRNSVLNFSLQKDRYQVSDLEKVPLLAM